MLASATASVRWGFCRFINPQSLSFSNRFINCSFSSDADAPDDNRAIVDWTTDSIALMQRRINRWPRRRILQSNNPAELISPVVRSPAAVHPAQPNERRASVAICLVHENGIPAILYTVRSAKLNSHSGQISFPGGIREKDETEVDTAIRELVEECGVDRSRLRLIGVHHDARAFSSANKKSSIVTPVILSLTGDIAEAEHAIQPNADEVDFYFTVPITQLLDKQNHTLVHNWPAFRHLHRWTANQGGIDYTLATNNMSSNTDNSSPRSIGSESELSIWGATGYVTNVFLNELIKPKQ